MTALAPAPARLRTGLGGASLAGGLGSLALLAALAGWAAFTPIGGAVIAPGQVMVRGNPKVVQSLDGGIVDEIMVENGDHVANGELLLRLDPTVLKVQRDIATNRLAAALARAARLEAEQVGSATPAFAYATLPFPLPDLAREEEGQRRIFAARAEVLAGRREQLAEQEAQFDSQREGIEGMIAAKEEQLALIRQELDKAKKLYAQGLSRETSVLELQRQEAELLGQLSAHRAELAQVALSARDAELEVVQAERGFREQVVTELRETRTEVEELVLQIVDIDRRLERVEIRAPAAGVVHEMQAGTVGGVVGPGAVILQVVPVEDGVTFEARVDPRAIDQVHPGQKAHVVLPAFDQRTTPRLAALVADVSPTAIADPATGASYYRVTLEIPPEELSRLGPARLVPGMPVEAFLETAERSVLGYLLKPLSAQLERAFRED